jgi:hypothetical protein
VQISRGMAAEIVLDDTRVTCAGLRVATYDRVAAMAVHVGFGMVGFGLPSMSLW